jgi:soluble lytic murein transglycosylase-like protein
MVLKMPKSQKQQIDEMTEELDTIPSHQPDTPRTLAPSHLSGREDYLKFASLKAKEFGVDPKILHSMMEVESGFDPNAESPVGARGLMQVMPNTAEKDLGISRDDLFDPIKNITAGARHTKNVMNRLKYWGDKLGVDVPINVETISAAYNRGTRGIVEDMKRFGPDWRNKVNPETKGHIRKVSKIYSKL